MDKETALAGKRIRTPGQAARIAVLLTALALLPARAELILWTGSAVLDGVAGTGRTLPGLTLGSTVNFTITANTDDFFSFGGTSTLAAYGDSLGQITYSANGYTYSTTGLQMAVWNDWYDSYNNRVMDFVRIDSSDSTFMVAIQGPSWWYNGTSLSDGLQGLGAGLATSYSSTLRPGYIEAGSGVQASQLATFSQTIVPEPSLAAWLGTGLLAARLTRKVA